ncbi:MAG: dTDP-4-dehydrorhamnose reductase [Desulfobacterales bacterium]
MKILITGSEGQLGWELLRQAAFFNIEAVGLDLPFLDITDEPGIIKVVNEHKPDILINAAAYTNVDKAETDEKTCFAVNVNGPENLASACRNAEIPMIHISTDYVFDGTNKIPYTENDPVAPASVYGRSKVEGENGVRNILEKHVILRTSWLYGFHGHNFVKTILRLGMEKEVIGVVSDQFGSPTSAADLAETILIISNRFLKGNETAYGTYNYCGEGITSWHGFAEKIIETAKLYSPVITKFVKPLTTDEYPTKAKRPAFSALDCRLIQQKFGITPKPWQKSLEAVIGKIYSCKD